LNQLVMGKCGGLREHYPLTLSSIRTQNLATARRKVDMSKAGQWIVDRMVRLSVVCSVAVFVLAGCTMNAPADSPSSAPGSAATASDVPRGAAADQRAGLADVPQVAAKLRPSVVTVLVNGGTGSGVVYSSDGLILRAR
jgi:hypothetical protein